MEWYIRVAETGLVPDFLIRIGIRRILHSRLDEFRAMDAEEEGCYISGLVEKFSQGPIAVSVDRANEQHYELPPEFFGLFLGKYRKYSSGCWPDSSPAGHRDIALDAALDASESAMLELTVRRAQIADGQCILDLGCG